MMLAQLVALLALGALCSPAPTPAPQPSKARCLNGDQSFSIEGIIHEVLDAVKSGNVTAPVQSSVPVDVTDKGCVHENVGIFIKSLETNKEKNGRIITQLRKVHACKDLFGVQDTPCESAQVSSQTFIKKFEKFLKHVYVEL